MVVVVVVNSNRLSTIHVMHMRHVDVARHDRHVYQQTQVNTAQCTGIVL